MRLLPQMEYRTKPSAGGQGAGAVEDAPDGEAGYPCNAMSGAWQGLGLDAANGVQPVAGSNVDDAADNCRRRPLRLAYRESPPLGSCGFV